MTELLECFEEDGKAFVFPGAISHIKWDVDKDAIEVHLINGEIVYYKGTLEQLGKWVKKYGKD